MLRVQTIPEVEHKFRIAQAQMINLASQMANAVLSKLLQPVCGIQLLAAFQPPSMEGTNALIRAPLPQIFQTVLTTLQLIIAASQMLALLRCPLVLLQL